MTTNTKRNLVALVALCLAACSAEQAPDGLMRTPPGNGPTIRFDLYHKPLPEIPLPNDAAMWPDPTSRTGLRINSSAVAPTTIESVLRKKLDTLEGWGTFAPITISFKKKNPDDTRAAIDLQNVIQRHQHDHYDPADDVMYVVNLKTGIPSPLDIGGGAFQYIIRDTNNEKYWANDTRNTEENLLFESADETIDPVTGQFDPARTSDGTRTGKPIYKPEWDTDFDGVLDRPDLVDPNGCPNRFEVAGDPAKTLARDQCIANTLLTWYERETDTLIARPLVPLEEKTEYAVVITDRLVDPDGNPVKSPFDFVYYPAQEQSIEKLRGILSSTDTAKTAYFGDIAGTGLKHVAFAWTFTTEPVQEDLVTIRNGMYGKGPLKKLATDFPPHAEIARAPGLVDLDALAGGAQEPADWKTNPTCVGKADNYRIVKLDQIQGTLQTLVSEGFGIGGPSQKALTESFKSIDHFVVGTFKSPWFLEGGPDNRDPNASFDVDVRTGKGQISSDTVQFIISVPKPTPGHAQPFPIAYNGHGYTGGDFESLGYAGYLAEQGIASVGMNAVSHGLVLDPATMKIASSLFTAACEGPFGSAFLEGRAKDLNNDGQPESGGDYWTAYLFHTRDVVRQTAIDALQMFRIFKTYDGKTMDVHQSAEGDAKTVAGDFDGDGVPDVGGPHNGYYVWGQSLGGIGTSFVMALDPDVQAGVPGSGAGGLLDVGSRTVNGGAFEGIFLREFGPLVVGRKYEEVDPKKTTCKAGEISLRFVVVDINTTAEVEFGCFNPVEQTSGAGLPKGATVIVTDANNGKVRCARMDKDGHFRIGIPTSAGDKLEVQIWDKPDAIDTYDGDHGCNIVPSKGAKRIELINKWGKGLVGNGAVDPTGRTDKVVCTEQDGCTAFEGNYAPAHSTLTALVDGLGLIRQTPDVRRFLNIAGNVVDPGDPVNFAPYAALRPMLDPDGNVQRPRAFLNYVSIGDPDVPISAGVALGRAAGAVPFLAPEAAAEYPGWANYATPQKLFDELGGKTPNDVYVDNYVLEGRPRLRRAPPPAGTCQDNEVPLSADPSDTLCHPNCTPGGDTSACLSDDSEGSDKQYCDADGRCKQNPGTLPDTLYNPDKCANTLFDPDWLGEGADLWGQLHPTIPVRSARVAAPANASNLDAIWAPRIMGEPGSPDAQGWTADKKVLAQLIVYTSPEGSHGFDQVDPCQAFPIHRYMPALLGRFFSTNGADLYYLSHPSSHHCLARPLGKGSCTFEKAPQ